MKERFGRRLSSRTLGWFTLCLAALALAPASAFAAPCDVTRTLAASPVMPDDGSVVTYTLTYCDPTGFGASVFDASIRVDRAYFVPYSSVWTSCPTGGCSTGEPDGQLFLDGFTLAADECIVFEFTIELQAGLPGASVCIQGNTTVKSNSPPSSPFPCISRTDDPATATLIDPTCVTVAPPPCSITVTVDPTFLEACAGDGSLLSAAGSSSPDCPGGTLTYQWTRDGVPIAGATEVDYLIPASEPAGAHQYRVLVTCAALPECSKLSVRIDTFLYPIPGTLIVPELGCRGDAVDVYVDGAFPCSIDCGNGDPVVASCFALCTYDAPGPYTVTAAVSDATCSGEHTAPLEIIETPIACIEEAPSVCETAPHGPSLITLGNCSVPGLTYAWSASTGTLDDAAAREPVLTLPDVTSATPVSVDLTVSSSCGTPDMEMWSFDLLPSPVATASHEPLDACLGQEVSFEGSGSDTPGPFEFLWDFGDGDDSTAEDPVHSYADSGTYDVTFTVKDLGTGCETTLPLSVVIGESCCAAVIPEVANLKAAKAPTADDITFEWLPVVEATGGYNVWRTTVKAKIPITNEAGAADPDVFEVCRPTPVTSCVHAGAVTGPADTVFYYQAFGVCGGIEGD